MHGLWVALRYGMSVLILAAGVVRMVKAQPPSKAPLSSKVQLDRAALQEFVTRHCTSCHNREDKKGGLALDIVSSKHVGAHPDIWEKVVRKLTARQMPPPGKPRPDERTYVSIVTALESELDHLAALRPNPGRTPTFRRLNRTEYQNAIRDLLALDVDAAALLPAGEANHG